MSEQPQNLNQAILNAMDTYAGRTCFRIKQGQHYQDITYRQLRVISFRLAAFFQQQGISTEERIAILHEANVMEMEAFVVVPYVFQETLYAWNMDKLGDYHTTFVGGYNYLYLQPTSN